MVEEVLQEPEQQQEPTQQDPPKKRLWSKLSGSKLYTKSYEDFEKQFSTPESIDRLYVVLNKKQLYTKTKGEFTNQFFSQPSKKKLVQSILRTVRYLLAKIYPIHNRDQEKTSQQ